MRLQEKQGGRQLGFIGDIHGCVEELSILYRSLLDEGVAPEDIWHTGDVVDRGPDSSGVIRFLISRGIRGVKGNHDAVAVEHWGHYQASGVMPTKQQDKIKTVLSLDVETARYLDELPPLVIFDWARTILVHGGLYPDLEFYRQPSKAIMRLQLIHPDPNLRGQTRWFNLDTRGRTEEQNRLEGWVRWYEVWDHEYDVVFGHTGFEDPLIHQQPEPYGACIGIDTGCCFGRALSAVLMPSRKIIQVPAQKAIDK